MVPRGRGSIGEAVVMSVGQQAVDQVYLQSMLNQGKCENIATSLSWRRNVRTPYAVDKVPEVPDAESAEARSDPHRAYVRRQYD